ncbi:MAG: hypothetical protein IIW10_03980 [Spirochaetaceae bacterium]|nr:hypothetical protein [Spirochaetaceae bacterium]
MRKLYFFAAVALSAFSAFSVDFSVSNEVDIRSRKLPFDIVARESEHSLDMLRNTTDLRIKGEKFDFFYRARLNFHEYSRYSDVISGFLPGENASQINLLIHPCKYFSFGVGTDFDLKAGPVSLWDDDIYYASTGSGMWNKSVISDGSVVPGVGVPADSIVRTRGRGAQPFLSTPATYATSGLLLEIKPIQGLMVAVNVPIQSFRNLILFNGISGRDFQMRFAATYTAEQLFHVGVSCATSFDASRNPWSIYAGAELLFMGMWQPQLFFNYISRGAGDGETSVFRFNSQTNFGLRLPFSIGKFSFSPELAVSAYNFPNGISSYEEDFLRMKRGVPIFVAIPFNYNFNDNISAGLWLSYAMGALRNERQYPENRWNPVVDSRVVIRPEGYFVTPVGDFGVRVWMILDIRQGDLFDDKDGVAMGYRLDCSWKVHYK